MEKKELEHLLKVGVSVEIGKRYVRKHGGFKVGEVITLIQGTFERDGSDYTITETAPSIWDESQQDYDSIYHLFGNDLEDFEDCKILPLLPSTSKPATNETL
jgi:hypothetical protein